MELQRNSPKILPQRAFPNTVGALFPGNQDINGAALQCIGGYKKIYIGDYTKKWCAVVSKICLREKRLIFMGRPPLVLDATPPTIHILLWNLTQKFQIMKQANGKSKKCFLSYLVYKYNTNHTQNT